MLLPKSLKYGDTVGIYSPSSPVTYTSPKRFERAKSYLQQKGFHILEGSLTGRYDFYRSGSIQERAEELNVLIRNPNISCIMSTIGGMNSNSILPYIDYDAFLKNPKIMIGYSDATALLLAIYTKTGIPTFYGPALVPSFGEFEPFVDCTYKYFAETLLHDHSLPYHIKQPLFWSDEFINWEEKTKEKELRPNDWISVIDGKATGRIIGGNLNTIQGIWVAPICHIFKKATFSSLRTVQKMQLLLKEAFHYLKLTMYSIKFQVSFLENMSNLMIVVQIENLLKYY